MMGFDPGPLRSTGAGRLNPAAGHHFIPENGDLVLRTLF